MDLTPYDGKKADIFSLGACLYNLIFQKPAFGIAFNKDPKY